MRVERPTVALLAAALVLAACRTASPPGQATPAAERSLPVDAYLRLADEGARLFRLDPENSRIDVVVRREGPLARLGHDHVIVVRDPEGLAASVPASARADLRFSLSAMDVDPASARARHGLDSEPSAEDIEGTRRNMLEAALDAATWPDVHVAVSVASALARADVASLVIDLHGQAQRVVAPVRVEADAATGATVVHARFDLAQSAFGIEPYSALGGSLRVADALEVHARLVFAPTDERMLAGRAPDAGHVQQRRRSE
jgi:hypothetical protein